MRAQAHAGSSPASSADMELLKNPDEAKMLELEGLILNELSRVATNNLADTIRLARQQVGNADFSTTLRGNKFLGLWVKDYLNMDRYFKKIDLLGRSPRPNVGHLELSATKSSFLPLGMRINTEWSDDSYSTFYFLFSPKPISLKTDFNRLIDGCGISGISSSYRPVRSDINGIEFQLVNTSDNSDKLVFRSLGEIGLNGSGIWTYCAEDNPERRLIRGKAVENKGSGNFTLATQKI